MTAPIELTVGHLIPFFDKHELLLIKDKNDVELFSNYAIFHREEYNLQEEVSESLCNLKIDQISCTDDGEVFLLVKEE